MQTFKEMLGEHWVWGTVMIAVLVWYSTITIYIAIRGAFDVKDMLAELGSRKDAQNKTEV